MRFGHVSLSGLAGLAAMLGTMGPSEALQFNQMQRPAAKRPKQKVGKPRKGNGRKTKQFKLKGLRP